LVLTSAIKEELQKETKGTKGFQKWPEQIFVYRRLYKTTNEHE